MVSFIKSDSMSFRGWDLLSFLKGRKKLVINTVGYLVGYVITRHPVYAGMVMAGGDLIVAVIEYYFKEIEE